MPDHTHAIAQDPLPPLVTTRASVTRISTQHVWVTDAGYVCGALNLDSGVTITFRSALQVRQLAAALPDLAARMEELAAGEGGGDD